MSATNRGGERAALDFYETPREAIDVFIQKALLALYRGPEKLTIVDAGCGTGAITERLQYFFPHATVYGCDIEFRPEFFDRCPNALFLGGNFLDELFPKPTFAPIDLICMNPPYSLAQAFVEHALTLTDGPVAALLRVGFLEGTGRAEWLKRNTPDVYVLSDRPSFCRSVACSKKCGWKQYVALDADYLRVCPSCGAPTKNSTSDSAAYAWMVWRREGSREGKLRIL